MRHAFWNALIQVMILWLTITFCWARFLWLVNGPWLVVVAAIAAVLPIPFVLTWIGDRVSQAVRGEKVTLD